MKKVIKYTVYVIALFCGAVIGASLAVTASIDMDRNP